MGPKSTNDGKNDVQEIKINISRAAGEGSETMDSRKAKEPKNSQQASLKKINEFT